MFSSAKIFIAKGKIKFKFISLSPSPIFYKADEIIKENVQTDKKIRKDAVRLCDIVVTSDPKFYNKLTDIEIRKFFKENYEFLCNRYRNESIVYSTVHLDETTPI
ncbi:plasmid recombination protein [Tissierella praeacuta]|uniref:plasmid recombination protein n=1 Tax=Tissierella praeacuta TaxID=43131 RepID=UPI00333FC674